MSKTSGTHKQNVRYANPGADIRKTSDVLAKNVQYAHTI